MCGFQFTKCLYFCSYVSKLMEENDISWVPKGVALGVNDATEMESEIAEERMAKHFRYGYSFSYNNDVIMFILVG